jgi:outer membrane lipoprotein carrier protein
MQNTRRAIVAVSLAVALPGTAPAQAPSAIVDKAVAAWAKVHSLSGTFEQTLTSPLLRSSNLARGEFRQERPNKLAIRFTEPAGDAVVADGKFLWVYLQQAAPNQVMKRPATDRMDVPIDVSQFLESPTTKYDIVANDAESVGGRPARVLALTPKKGTRSAFTHATVWVDDADGLIRQFEVAEPNGNTRRIRLTTLTVNPTLTAADFSFTVPKGAKVITP